MLDQWYFEVTGLRHYKLFFNKQTKKYQYFQKIFVAFELLGTYTT